MRFIISLSIALIAFDATKIRRITDGPKTVSYSSIIKVVLFDTNTIMF